MAEQPILTIYHEGFYGAFGAVIVDVQSTTLQVTHQFRPLVVQISDGFIQFGFWQYVLFAQLGMQFPFNEAGLLLVRSIFFFRCFALKLELDAVEFLNKTQRHIRFSGFTFSLHVFRFNELLPGNDVGTAGISLLK